MSEIILESAISSVRDEVAKINGRKPPLVPTRIPRVNSELIFKVPSSESIQDCINITHYNSDSDTCSNASVSSVISNCTRARRGDVYTLVPNDTIVKIIADIDSGVLVSNTACAPWGRGQKHHPNHHRTFKVRRHLEQGAQTREQIEAALPSISPRHLTAILHELREQGIVKLTREVQ